MAIERELTASGRAPNYLVDTSVVLKWFVERGEAYVAEARILRDAHIRGRCTLRAPELLTIEVANALAMGQRHERRLVHEALESLRGIGVDLSAVDWLTLGHSVELAASLRVTVYDACFLALAIAYGIPLVTADDAFLRRLGPHPNAIALRDLQLPL